MKTKTYYIAEQIINMKRKLEVQKQTKKYRVEIELLPLGYEIKATDEDKAKEYAQECFYDETMYDLLKYAKYKIVEVNQ
jgi:hypothetical protein